MGYYRHTHISLHKMKLGYGNEQLKRDAALRAAKIPGTAHVLGPYGKLSSDVIPAKLCIQ